MKDTRPLGAVISAAIAGVVIGAILLLGVNAQLNQILAENQAEARGIGTTQFTSAVVFKEPITVNRESTFTGAMTAGAVSATSLTATSSTSAAALSAASLSVTGAATFSTSPIFSTESITPTNGGTITPTASLVTLTPAGAVGVDLGICTTGMVAVLYNSVNANVVITDTGNFIGAGNQTLGQFDALPLACLASKWVQTGPVSAN